MACIGCSKSYPNGGIEHSGISKNWWVNTRFPGRQCMGVVNLSTLKWPSTPVIKQVCEDDGPENWVRTE